MVQQMLRRLVQWLKSFFQGLFGGGRKQTAVKTSPNVTKQPAPPLGDTDLEFLFTELLEGVHQARGQAWAVKWLQKIEHRVTTAQWVEWLRRFGEKLLASSSPNNELAARLVQLGELGVGELGDVAYDIGMQVLSRNQGEPIWNMMAQMVIVLMYYIQRKLFPQLRKTQKENIKRLLLNSYLRCCKRMKTYANRLQNS